MEIIKKILSHIPTGLLSILVIAFDLYASLASDPTPNSITLFQGADKIIHFLLYFVITLVMTYDYAKYCFPRRTRVDLELFVMAIAMLLGLLLEITQLFMGLGRCFEWTDVAANCLGALTAFGLQRLWLMRHIRKLFHHKSHHHHHHKHNK